MAWVSQRYEKLRLSSIGQPSSPDDRYGLVIFLYQGMWRWVQMIISQRTERASSDSGIAAAPYLCDPLSSILASMIINNNN